MINKERAELDRMSYSYRPGVGYQQVGRLMLPPNPIYAREQCEPNVLAVDGSLHFLNPPMGAEPQMMEWHPQQREWASLNPGLGKRIGFTSQYLAAYGWAYLGPVSADFRGSDH